MKTSQRGRMTADVAVRRLCGSSAMHMGAWRRAVNAAITRASAWRGGIAGALLAVGCMLTALTVPGASAQSAAPGSSDKPIKIVAFGDSLTAGYLLAPNEAFPVVLGKALVARGYNVEVVNAGVSGDTTSAGRERINWAVPPDADAVILEFGGNDALRGLDPAVTRRNLEAIIVALQAQKADILLAGMLAPRSLGDTYTMAFDGIFPDLANRYGLLLYPFFLDKTGMKPKLSLADGLHPNARGVEAIVGGILPKAEELIARVKARRLAAAKG